MVVNGILTFLYNNKIIIIMPKLDIYCFSMKYFNLLDKLPSYIRPFGLGNNNYPENWLTEKNGENILNLNKYYGEASGVFIGYGKIN